MDSDTRAPSPTNTEWNTFQVMANPSFINVGQGRPTFARPTVPPPPPPESPPPTDALSDVGDSISVVAEQQKAALSAFRPVLTTLREDDRSSVSSHKTEDHPAPPVRAPTPERRPSVSTVATHKSSVSEAPPPPVAPPPVASRATPEDVRAKARQMTEADVLLEKEGLLAELSMMQKQGIVTLYRELTIKDSLQEIQFQYDRAMSNYNAMQTVEMAKTGLKVMSTLMEMMFNKMGLKLLDGFSGHLCKDMSRFNRPLTKMYRKYWRGASMSPETELSFIIFGSVLVTILHNKGLGMFANMMPTFDGSTKEAPSATPPLARPMPPPAPPTTNVPAVPVMKRPSSVAPPEVPAPEVKAAPRSVSIGGAAKPHARKSNKNDDILNL